MDAPAVVSAEPDVSEADAGEALLGAYAVLPPAWLIHAWHSTDNLAEVAPLCGRLRLTCTLLDRVQRARRDAPSP